MEKFMNGIKQVKWYEWCLLVMVVIFGILSALSINNPNVEMSVGEKLVNKLPSIIYIVSSALGLIICSKGNRIGLIFLIISGSLLLTLILFNVNSIKEGLIDYTPIFLIVGSIISCFVWSKHKDENDRIKVKKLPTICSIVGICIIVAGLLFGLSRIDFANLFDRNYSGI